MDCNILKVILIQGFCPSVKLKFLDFLSDFDLRRLEECEEQCQLVKHFCPNRVRLCV